MLFYDWILTRRVTESPRGDFIFDVKRDKRFTEINDEESIEGYLIRRHACPEAIVEFHKLWREHERRCLKKISKTG